MGRRKKGKCIVFNSVSAYTKKSWEDFQRKREEEGLSHIIFISFPFVRGEKGELHMSVKFGA